MEQCLVIGAWIYSGHSCWARLRRCRHIAAAGVTQSILERCVITSQCIQCVQLLYIKLNFGFRSQHTCSSILRSNRNRRHVHVHRSGEVLYSIIQK